MGCSSGMLYTRARPLGRGCGMRCVGDRALPTPQQGVNHAAANMQQKGGGVLLTYAGTKIAAADRCPV
jgi:hypothetical protein